MQTKHQFHQQIVLRLILELNEKKAPPISAPTDRATSNKIICLSKFSLSDRVKIPTNENKLTKKALLIVHIKAGIDTNKACIKINCFES